VVQVNARFDSDKKRLIELTDAAKPTAGAATTTTAAAKDAAKDPYKDSAKAAPKKN
jgi:hypothetical protein